ncbi:hydroxycinnamoyltransferase-like [Gastrolobium bilobum]|uniref:hydroxycinnamoyltransferase-like n=1 Tax=Gastrolobium bilobum TaxID=150636 RepID=UPI002AB27218|nr:hydroxycinnamoyltransferase-like [Gastrolobium bilobum]
MSTSRVTLHSKLTAVSSKPGSGKTHTLSALDHAMGFHTVHIIFYYKNDDNLFGSFDIDPLRESLSEVLTMYPTMTGRLARGMDGNWQVRCSDAGVRVLKAKVDTTLDEWLSSGSQESHLIAWDDMPDDPSQWSPFRIQINSFREGGVAIGLSCSHMLADLTCAASFLKSWTEAHRRLPITNPPFFSSLRNADATSLTRYATIPSTKTQTSPSRNMATATFKFSSSSIELCLSKVHDECPNATPFDFLSALFWTRIARLKLPKNHDQTHSLSICTDFRRLLKEPLPIGYFGNAVHFSKLSLKVKDTDSERLGSIASQVHRHLEGVAEEEIWCAIEWFESQKESEGGKFKSPTCMYGPELTCVCMEHMIISSEEADQPLLYAAMFSKNEKPAHVSCHVGNMNGEGLIMVMPSLEGGLARTVMVMLPEEELPQLCNDQVISQLEPTMLLTGCVLDH